MNTTVLNAPVGVSAHIRRLTVILIKPSNYTTDGHLLQFRKAVIPCNSLAVLNALTKQAFLVEALRDLECEILAFDELAYAQSVEPKNLMARYGGDDNLVVVGLTGVQTNQFPRAVDLGREFLALGATVVIGGFHVSGSIATMLDGIADDNERKDVPCPKIMPPEVQEIMDEGFIVFHGEAEEVWALLLGDIVRGHTRQLYRGGNPPLSSVTVPEYPPHYFESFATRVMTYETGRGCKWACSYCAIIQVLGRTMRFFNPDEIIASVRKMCDAHERLSFFFTDDNFARNPRWKEILEGLIALREEGYTFEFLVQIDLPAYKMPDFIEMLGAAGCCQAFLGVESIDPETLKATKKPQNKVANYPECCRILNDHGIVVHAGYIIGFPNDTPESIAASVETLKEIGFDKVSFFILTPLPGSEDHIRLYCSTDPMGSAMDSDFNLYDSFRPVADHPQMSRETLRAVYQQCWKEFYRSGQMIAVLRRCPPGRFWGVLKNLIWYVNASLGEKVHPMMCGFWSVRSRTKNRRPGTVIENVVPYYWNEFLRRLRYLFFVIKTFFVFQHVVFEGQLRPEMAKRVRGRVRGFRDWFSRTFHLPATRTWLNAAWKHYGSHKFHLLWKFWHHVKLPFYIVTEIAFLARYIKTIVRGAKVMMET